MEIEVRTEVMEATTGAAEEQLVHEGEVFINPPVTRQWVSVKLFALPDGRR
jgi:hypothetical protein